MENADNDQSTSPDMSHIKGWGIDADPKNDPTYPMRNRSEGGDQSYHWQRPPLQEKTVEVLHSIERPNLTAVFGTSVPPTGLSGWIRRCAFKYSEGSFGHWLPLLLADRVDEVEGVIDDLSHGNLPNICAERGMKAQWKHDQRAVMNKVTLGLGLLAAAVVVGGRSRDR